MRPLWACRSKKEAWGKGIAALTLPECQEVPVIKGKGGTGIILCNSGNLEQKKKGKREMPELHKLMRGGVGGRGPLSSPKPAGEKRQTRKGEDRSKTSTEEGEEEAIPSTCGWKEMKIAERPENMGRRRCVPCSAPWEGKKEEEKEFTY